MSFGCSEDNFWLDPRFGTPVVKGIVELHHPNFTGLKVVGGGAYSSVATAVDTRCGDKVAIKRVDQVFYSVTEAKKVTFAHIRRAQPPKAPSRTYPMNCHSTLDISHLL